MQSCLHLILFRAHAVLPVQAKEENMSMMERIRALKEARKAQLEQQQQQNA